MKMNLLFDLDGTLTDPKDGICRSIQYALAKLSVEPPKISDLEWCIGPPLYENFCKLLGESGDRAHLGVKYYRERFGTAGLFENSPYEGIEETLGKLKGLGHSLYVATSKPTIYSKKILSHFGLDRYFVDIYGSELDGSRRHKEDLIRYILDKACLCNESTIMIGDREHDLIGARANQIRSIGVTYGYGSLQELEAHTPIKICKNQDEIVEVISSLH